MKRLSPSTGIVKEQLPGDVPVTMHSSFPAVQLKIKKWINRFSNSVDPAIFTDLLLLFLLASRKYLDHRSPAHLFRLVSSIHYIQKKLLHSATFFPSQRHLQVRWIPTALKYPFSSKPVLGCLIGFNVIDRYELFDEENILLALQKHLPELRLVKESSYYHTSPHKNLKIFYFEIEKKNGAKFTLSEQNLLESNLEEKVKNSIQKLSPTIFMGHNEEEIYKNILVLSQEIKCLKDLPQAYITLDTQTGSEIIFRVILVHISPFHRFSLEGRFFECEFVLQRVLTVRQLENHPIEAHIFSLHLPRDVSYLRSNGSLDFYAARQKVVDMLKTAIGEFRDYNGGIIIKQQELLLGFKESFPPSMGYDSELMETFFYALTPIVKQVILPIGVLTKLFIYFLELRKQKLTREFSYLFKTYHDDDKTYLIVRGDNTFLIETFTSILQEQAFRNQDMAYNIIESTQGIFFNCVLLRTDAKNSEMIIHALRDSLEKWHQKTKKKQILRVALESEVVSLDPRIGGDVSSANMLRLLFEGLTRFGLNGNIENGIAETIKMSHQSKQYIFKLRPCLWNDGTPVSAYDFEYAWKKILSPDFKTAFAYLFDPIKNAREAKEGKVSLDEVGVHVIDDRTLKIELTNPTPNFLQLTAHPLYSPVHRLMDMQHPQWPYQCEKNYPCTGPFQLKINQPSQGYQLVRNPYYWDANHTSLDQIILTKMSRSQAIQSFQQKELDWVGNPFGVWDYLYNPMEEGRVVSFSNYFVCWCVFNTTQAPFHHQKFRQAMAYAIQRDKIISNSFLALNPAYSLLLPYHYNDHYPHFPDHNMEKARQLFKEALEELGMKFEELAPITITFHEKGIHKYIGEALKQQFEECLGIKCELKSLSWNEVFGKMTSSDFQIGLVHWLSWMDDPTYTLGTFKSAKQDLNFAKWEHPGLQKLINLSEEELNPFQRSSYLQQAEEILCREMPIIPLYYNHAQALVAKDLQVIEKNPCGFFNISKSFYTNMEN